MSLQILGSNGQEGSMSMHPFIKHIPIAIVMSISHISGCATICGKQKQRDYTYFDYTVFGFLISGKER